MQHVYTARDEMDASFVQGLLRQEGIEAVVQGLALGSAWGTLPLSDESLPTVWVEDKDVERARPVIETYRQTDQANADDAVADRTKAVWSCPNCGERVEEQFSQCWKCGHQRPASPVAEA
jgi:predicted RNA-binding Zn-ribbon protein involved in translation (DUF1610 family)